MTLTLDPNFRLLLPPLRQVQRVDLEVSLKRDGCLAPLIVWQPDKEQDPILLDGYHRYDICTKLSIPYRVEILRDCPNREAALKWIVSHQETRRNLTKSQWTAVAAELKRQLAIEAKKRQLSGLKQNQSPVRTESVQSDQSKSSEKAAKAYKKYGVSREGVNEAARIAENDPETFEKIKKGELTMAQAKKEAAAKPKKTVQAPSKPKRKSAPKGYEIYRDGSMVMVASIEEHVAWGRQVTQMLRALSTISEWAVTPKEYIGMLSPSYLGILDKSIDKATAWIMEFQLAWQERRNATVATSVRNDSQLLH